MVELRLREILKFRGFTQAQLARELGVTTVTVNSWVANRRFPPIETLDRIATLLNVPFTMFFVESETNALHITARFSDISVDITPSLLLDYLSKQSQQTQN